MVPLDFEMVEPSEQARRADEFFKLLNPADNRQQDTPARRSSLTPRSQRYGWGQRAWQLLPPVLLLLIILVGTILRLYRLPETFAFAPDQGRDATIVWQMIETHTPVRENSAVGFFLS